jgi:xylulokinase
MGGTQIQAHTKPPALHRGAGRGHHRRESCLFSPSLELLACSVQEYALRTQGERVEADAAQYKAAARAGLADALSQAPGCIPAAVSITTQGETLTLADRSGEPLRPFLVWLDSRAENEAQALRSVLDNETFYKTTGLPEVTGALPLAKLLWLRKTRTGYLCPCA